MKAFWLLGMSVTIAPVLLMAGAEEPAQGLRHAAVVLSQIMAVSDRRIPEALLERAHCVVIVPDVEVGPFAIGATSGRGYVVCRQPQSARWSAPGVLTVEGGRVGLRIGGSSTDLVMLVINPAAANTLLDHKFALGPEGSVAAGPVGRDGTSMTDEQSRADILTWARSNGVLTGVPLGGMLLRQDREGNNRLYGRRLTTRDIVSNHIPPPGSATALLDVLSRYSVKQRTQ